VGALRPGSPRIRRPPNGQSRQRQGQPLPARAIVAIGRSILVISWTLLTDEQAQFTDLGPDYYAARNNPERQARHHIRELQALGYSVTLNPAA
jgi:hypothetical protein